MPTRIRPVAVAACLVVFATRAQSQTTAPPPSPPAGAPATPALEPPQSARELLQSAKDLVDQIDASPSEDPQPAALQELNRLILALQSVDPANPWLSYLYGRAFAFSGRNGDAIDQLRRFVETRDGRNDWKAFRVLGDLFVGEFPRLAKTNYERAATLNPDEPSVLMGSSLCAGKTGDRGEALRLARQAVEADGRRSPRYVNVLARALAAMKQMDEAEREALSALRLAEKGVADRPGVLGPVRTLAAQYDLLIEIVSNRIGEPAGASPDDYVRLTDYMARRAEITGQLARYDRLALLQQGMDAAANASPRLLERYAAALADVGRRDDAIAQFEKLLSLEPDNSVARERLAGLRTPPEHPDTTPQP